MSIELGNRLRTERKRLGLDQKAFAAVGHVNKNSQLAYELGRTSPNTDYLERIGDAGADIGYILTGRRSEIGAGVRDDLRRALVKADQQQSGDTVEVAEIDLRLGLGAVYMDEAAEPEMRSFSRRWLRHFTDSPPEELYWAPGQGDSMAPTINDGDIMLIDRRRNTVDFGDLYWAIAYGNVGMVKRLRPMPDGSLKIISNNQDVPPETAHDGEVHIFGRVVAVVKKV